MLTDCRQKQVSRSASACLDCGSLRQFRAVAGQADTASLRGASATFRGLLLDCFTAFAMTGWKVGCKVLNVFKETGRKWGIIGLVLAALAVGLTACGSGNKPIAEYAPDGHKGEDLTPVYMNVGWGYVNAQGKMVIPPRFDGARDFSAYGLAAVMEGGSRDYRNYGKWGYINAKGEWVIPPRFASDQANSLFPRGDSDFAPNGLALIMENGKYGYINAKGEWVIRPKFTVADKFADNGLAYANGWTWLRFFMSDIKYHLYILQNKKIGYINAQGKLIIPPKFSDVSGFAPNGLARIMENGKYGYINAQGEWVIPPRFVEANSFTANGLAQVGRNPDSCIDARGEIVVTWEEVCKNTRGACFFNCAKIKVLADGIAIGEENESARLRQKDINFVNAAGKTVFSKGIVCGGGRGVCKSNCVNLV